MKYITLPLMHTARTEACNVTIIQTLERIRRIGTDLGKMDKNYLSFVVGTSENLLSHKPHHYLCLPLTFLMITKA